MGLGDFLDGQVELRVSFLFSATPADIQAWTSCFEQASQMLFHATKGTVRFAKIVYSNDSSGERGADAVVTSNSQWSYFGPGSEHTSVAGGFFGTEDLSMTLARSAVSSPFTVLHEFAHYAFGLGDEYFDANGPTQCTSNQQVVAAPDPSDPNTERACIMGAIPIENGGKLSIDPEEGWITEFCTEANHAHNPDTSQADIHGTKACATVIQEFNEEVDIATGLAADASFDGHTPPEWELADPGSDIILVPDGAAFGAAFGAAAGATQGETIMEAANYMMESADSSDDSVMLVPYGTPLPHHHVLAENTVDQAVQVAAHMIKKRARRRVTRAIVVFATGPDPLPSMSALTKQLARDGIRVIAVGLGQNQSALQKLAQRSNGAYYEVNPRDGVDAVRDDVMSFADELRFGPPILKLSSDSGKTKKKELNVDKGSKRLKFVLSHPPNSGLTLSAEPVGGRAPHPDDAGVSRLANPQRSYQTLTVERPVHGKWVVGVKGPADVPFTLTAYSDNPQVRVGVSGAKRLYRRGDTVTLHTVVSCPAPLVGLSKAVVKVTSPKGKTKKHRLKPGRGGVHSASFKVDEHGPYEIDVVVRNKGAAEPAGLAPKDMAAFKAAIDVPEFRRVRRFRVQVV